MFRGEHLVASDEYYEWWSTHEADFSKVAFHICEKARHRCKIDGGPREEVIHLTKWRMASPQTLIGSGFASTKAIAYSASLLDHHLATAGPLPPAPPAALTTPPPGEAEAPGGRPLAHTSGLDVAALAGGRRHERGDDEAVDELLALAKDAKREPDERKRGPKRDRGSEKGLSQLLAERAAQQREEQREHQHRDKSRRKRRKEDDEDKVARKKRLGVDDSDSGESSVSELKVKFVGLLENVVMDEEDRNDISYRLGWMPNFAESGEISCVRRPRLYWLNRDVPQMPWMTVEKGDVITRLSLSGPVEPEELWMPEGYSWKNPDRRRKLPTFTRPIRRRKPPPSPAGLKGCPKVAQDRWERDDFRYPPYVYRDENLLQDEEGNWQKVPAESRELLMGFKRHHTLKLDRVLFKETQWHDSEDVRQAAIGNSFHTTTVALILGAVLEDMGFLKSCLS